MNSSSVSSGNVEKVGSPEFQAFPISITIDPLLVSKGSSDSPTLHNQFLYSSPFKLPYFFALFKGNGGDVNIKFICSW